MGRQYGIYGKPFSSTGGMSGSMNKPNKAAPGAKVKLGAPGGGNALPSEITLPGTGTEWGRKRAAMGIAAGPITGESLPPGPPAQNVRQPRARRDIAGNVQRMVFERNPHFGVAAQQAGLVDNPLGQSISSFGEYYNDSPGGLLYSQLSNVASNYGGPEEFFRAFGVNPNSPKQMQSFLAKRLGSVVSEYGGDWLAAVRRVVADMNYEASGMLAGSPEENVFGGGEMQALVDALRQLGGLTGATAPADNTPEEQTFGPVVDPRLLNTPFGF